MKNYLKTHKNNKKEIIKLSLLALFTLLIVTLFSSPFMSSSNYDMRGEFLGYLLQLSFLLFLYIDYKSKNIAELKNFKRLSYIQFSLAIFSFLILKTMWFVYIIKLFFIYAALFLFLFLITIITKYD